MNMRITFSVLLIFSALIFTNCQDKSMESFTMDTPFMLNVGEMNLNPDALMTLNFVEMKEDSRCPEDVTCMWEGRVVVVMEAVLEGKTKETFLLSTSNRMKDAGTAYTVGNYQIQMVSVKPSRGAQANEIPKDSYQVEVKVVAAQNTQ